MEKHWIIYTDGASRGNPGPSGVGFVIYQEETLIEQKGFKIQATTNNQAEYAALIVALMSFKHHATNNCVLAILCDSLLMVKQMSGAYKVKNRQLARLHTYALSLLGAYQWKIHHVPRERNVLADKLANNGIDNEILLPEMYNTIISAILQHSDSIN